MGKKNSGITGTFNIMMVNELFLSDSHSFFPDTSAFTTSFTEVIKLCTANLTYLMQHDAFYIRRVDRKKTLNTDAIAHFTYCK